MAHDAKPHDTSEDSPTRTSRRRTIAGMAVGFVTVVALVGAGYGGWRLIAAAQDAAYTAELEAGLADTGAKVSEATPEPEVLATTEQVPLSFYDVAGPIDGVLYAITSIDHVWGDAVDDGPFGPAVRVSLEARNVSDAPIDLDALMVAAAVGPDRVDADRFAEPGGQPFAGMLDPGQAAQATYLFAVGDDYLSDVAISVTAANGASVVFAGDATEDLYNVPTWPEPQVQEDVAPLESETPLPDAADPVETDE